MHRLTVFMVWFLQSCDNYYLKDESFERILKRSRHHKYCKET